MKKKFYIILTITIMILSLAACGNSSSKNDDTAKPKKKEYISESDMAELFTSPDKFKGKYVKITGQIFIEPEKEGDTTAFQAWHDPQNAQNNFIVHYSGSESFKANDFVKVDGKIAGTFKGENAFGSTITAPLIQSDASEVLSYMQAVVPTTKEITPDNAIAEQNGISLKVDKVEFAEKETRVYLTESNSSADKFSMWVYSIKLVQNGQQIEQDSSSMSSYEGNYAKLSDDILPNASSSGVLVFPAMDSSASFQIYAEGISDNYEIQFAPFTIDIAAQ